MISLAEGILEYGYASPILVSYVRPPRQQSRPAKIDGTKLLPTLHWHTDTNGLHVTNFKRCPDSANVLTSTYYDWYYRCYFRSTSKIYTSNRALCDGDPIELESQKPIDSNRDEYIIIHKKTTLRVKSIARLVSDVHESLQIDLNNDCSIYYRRGAGSIDAFKTIFSCYSNATHTTVRLNEIEKVKISDDLTGAPLIYKNMIDFPTNSNNTKIFKKSDRLELVNYNPKAVIEDSFYDTTIKGIYIFDFDFDNEHDLLYKYTTLVDGINADFGIRGDCSVVNLEFKDGGVAKIHDFEREIKKSLNCQFKGNSTRLLLYSDMNEKTINNKINPLRSLAPVNGSVLMTPISIHFVAFEKSLSNIDAQNPFYAAYCNVKPSTIFTMLAAPEAMYFYLAAITASLGFAYYFYLGSIIKRGRQAPVLPELPSPMASREQSLTEICPSMYEETEKKKKTKKQSR